MRVTTFINAEGHKAKRVSLSTDGVEYHPLQVRFDWSNEKTNKLVGTLLSLPDVVLIENDLTKL